MNAADMDVVYICKGGETNEELRHSLRSLINLPHQRVWVVGYKPRWTTEVGYLPVMQRGPKHANTWKNWLALAGCADISERFVLFNDDFYVTRPIEQIPTLNRGDLEQMAQWYKQRRLVGYHTRTTYTHRLLRQAGLAEPLYSYELHAPMVVNRPILAEAVGWLQTNRNAPLENVSKRTFYGNYARVGGETVRDVKVAGATHGLPETSLPFLSTSPSSWPGLAGGWVRRVFSQPSPYELVSAADTLYRPPASRGARR